MIKAPKIQSLPDILTLAEVEPLIGATRKLRYRVFLLATYSMGLRLGETLALEVGDIDSQRKQVPIRRGKGHKDRRITYALPTPGSSPAFACHCAGGWCGSGEKAMEKEKRQIPVQ